MTKANEQSSIDSQIQEDIKFYSPLINYVTPFFALAAVQLSDFASFLMKEESISLALPVTILLYNKFSGQIIGMRRQDGVEIWKGEVADEEAVQKYVESLIDENPVLLFTKAVDLQSSRANFILNDGGVQYNNIELDNDDYQYLAEQFDRFGSAFSDSPKKEVESKCP